ncbi:hypothetical protein [Rhodococcus sp. NPDC003348]
MTGTDRGSNGEVGLDAACGTRGETAMQDELGTSFRAERFYSRQMCSRLNPR